jgi:hypothetical protein
MVEDNIGWRINALEKQVEKNEDELHKHDLSLMAIKTQQNVTTVINVSTIIVGLIISRMFQ